MRLLKGLLLGGLLLWGLLALLVRAATPFISDYRDEIAALMSAELGAPVRIGALQARWYGFSPLLEAIDVRIGAAPAQLQITRIALQPTPAALAGAPPLRGMAITVDGLRVTVAREPDGRVHLLGLGPFADAADPGGADPVLPRALRLVNTKVTWVDRTRDMAPLVLDDVAASLEHSDGRFQIRARLEAGGGRALLAADIDGMPTGIGWGGESYLRVDNLDVAAALGAYLPAAYRLQQLRLDLESWGTWQQARPVRSQGRVSLRDLRLQGLRAFAGVLAVPALQADYTARRDEEALKLGLRELDIQFPGGRWPVGEIALALREPAPGAARVDLAASYLRLEDLDRALRVRLPSAELAAPLTGLAPRGEVRDLRLQLTHADGGTDWQLSAAFADLATNAWEQIPAIEGLRGRLLGRAGHVVLDLDGEDASLRFDRMFREPIALRRLQGRVDLQFDGGGWQARSDLLLADTPHIATRTRLYLDQRPGQSLFVDLQTDFRDGDVAFASLYYPVSKMSDHLVGWLDRSILSGRIVSGSALVYGPAEDYAFEKTMSGSFQAVFETEDVALDYKAGWPGIRDLDARVRLEGNHLDISSQSAAIYDSRVVDVHAHIAALGPDTAPLQVHGRLDGPLRNVLRVLQEDALAPRFGTIAAALDGDGHSELLLDFQVPLKRIGEYALDGELRFDGNRLRVPAYELDVEDVDGRLGFTLEGLSAEGIRARALGSPIAVDVAALGDGTTRVRTRGELDYAAVAGQFEFLPAALASGRSGYRIDVDVPPRDAAAARATMLRVRSDLEGTAVRLPAPLGKTAGEARPLELALPLDGPAADGGLEYGGLIAARFDAGGERLAIAFGAPPEPPDQADEPGISIRGHLAEVDLGAWHRALDDLGAGAGSGPPVTVDLAIDRARLDELALEAIALTAQRRAGAWAGAVAASALDGSFALPAAPPRAPVEVDLDRLHLSLPIDDEAANEAPERVPPDPAAGPDPRELPGLQLQVSDLRINAAELGRLQIEVAPAEDGLRIDRLSLDGGQIQLDGSGAWSVDATGTGTRITGTASATDVGGVVADIGFSPQIADAGGEISWRLAWPGHPAQVQASSLAGDLRLEVGAGRLVELEPGVGRVVGLLNLNALSRRLRLDFRDVFDEGFSFDSISGDFRVADGSAATDNLAIEGPSGRVLLKGSADLLARTLDQHVTVYPRASATLPIAGTLAGGPVVGVAVLVAQGVLAKQVDDINRFEYQVSGPWNAPKVEQLDSGGVLSKLVAPIGTASRRPEGNGGATGPPTAEAPASSPDRGNAPATPAADDGEQQAPDRLQQTLRGIVEMLQQTQGEAIELNP